MDQIKVLEISGGLNIGGAQTVAANISKYAPEYFRFCYITLTDKIGEYEQEILKRGDSILHWASPSKNPLLFFLKLVRLMKEQKFDVVHCHTMFNCGIVMLAAKLSGIPGRISHSHTTKEERFDTLVRRTYRFLMRSLIRLCGTDYWACGMEAGKVLYGDDWFTKKGIVIPNGINTAQYRFCEDTRNEIRFQYGIDDNYVIGHVGHYVEVKNQVFLIRLMKKLKQACPSAILLLFGEGEDRQMLQWEIDMCGVSDYVRMMGNVTNIGQVLSAFDVFVFPSLFEGTPLALIEAQANGLACIISDTIPDDACLTDSIVRLSLSDSLEHWISRIISARRAEGDQTSLLLSRYEDVHVSMNRMYRIFCKYKNNR